MKRHYKIITLMFIVFIIQLHSITTNQISMMQNSGEFIVGKGESVNEQEADNLALQDLASQIMVNVKSKFISIAKEENFEVEEYCENVVKTISNVQLSNARKYTDSISNDKKYIVYRYITQEDKDRIFSERKTQIMSLVAEGEIAEYDNNPVDAIRNYYWGLMLLKTHPEHKTITYYFDDKERNLNQALVNQIENLLSDISINVNSINEMENSNCIDVVLQASYKGIPADGILVKYNDGYDWSASERWSDGRGMINIKKTMWETMEFLDLEIDCSFAEHGFSGEIRNTLKTMKGRNFGNSHKKCFINEIAVAENQLHEVKFDKQLSKNQIESLSRVIDSINNKSVSLSRRFFTAKGFRDFNSLIGYGNAKIINDETKLKQLTIGEMKIVRSLPMKFGFNSSREDFTEKVNFVFDNEDKICGVTFALSDIALKDILDKKYGTLEEKAVIINFIEQYKTAYCLKDISFVENVFSDEALIIIGRVVKRKPDSTAENLYQQLGDDMVEYVKLSKGEYVNRLKTQFARKEFINIRFSDSELDRVTSDESKIYGMQIGQYYYSSDYCDKGYLFLMFNLEDPEKPQIMVRSWQPKKAEDGSIIGLSDFQFE